MQEQDKVLLCDIKSDILKTVDYFSKAINTLFEGLFPYHGYGIARRFYNSNLWPHLWNMSLHFEMCSIMVRLVSDISLSFQPCFYIVFSDAIHSFSVSINHLLSSYISVFQFSMYWLHVNISIFVVWDTTQDVRCEHNCFQ